MSIGLARWPLVTRVPVMVAVLVLLAAVLMSVGALLRLTQEQETRVSALGGAYLDTAAATLAPALARQDVWEAFDVLDRGKLAFGPLRLRLAAAILPDGTVLAATDPRRMPIGATPGPDLLNADTPDLVAEASGDLGWMARDVVESGNRLGRVLVEIDINQERVERIRLALVLLAANTGLALCLAVLGWWLTDRMLRPVSLLTAHLGGLPGRAPALLPCSALASASPEFRALFQRFNAMVASLEEREALAVQRAEEERLAMLGTLAGSMAHEVNNPLGGMLTAVDTIAAHGDNPETRAQSVGLLQRGLEDIRNVVRASLVIYKSEVAPVSTLTRHALDDLRVLAGPEARRRGVNLLWDNHLDAVQVDATPIRQVVLNLLLNAIAASPPHAAVRLSAHCQEGRLMISVADHGAGLPAAMAAILLSPSAMPLAGSTGLGLWAAARTALSLGGAIRALPEPVGTTLLLDVPLSSRRASLVT